MLTCSTPVPPRESPPSSQKALLPDVEEHTNGDQAPVTQAFLTSLLDVLKTDPQDHKRDLSQDLHNVKQDQSSLGDRDSSLEDNKTAKGEEI
ncbi:hypothetical protein NDU88_008090 [Pleurodeles waltl]|uniref:Uncharacterized protein n=1 Tax=Pleurodeles waltl TaxID=8319 RepID=A0AAV7NC31_PLEWA|nr:hypothetical protein NDU88_008090 [Pleurodeles waltl]